MSRRDPDRAMCATPCGDVVGGWARVCVSVRVSVCTRTDDALPGPLTPGDVGVIEKDDGSGEWCACEAVFQRARGRACNGLAAGSVCAHVTRVAGCVHVARWHAVVRVCVWACAVGSCPSWKPDKPYHIKAAGRVWWYKAEAVRLADSAGPVASQWRDQAVTKKYCSRPGDEEGPVCCHGTEIIRTDHWSCCGVGSRQAACTKVLGESSECTVRKWRHDGQR